MPDAFATSDDGRYFAAEPLLRLAEAGTAYLRD